MTRKNLNITVLAAVLVMAMSSLAFAGPGYGHGKGWGRGNCDGLRAQFSQLTPEKQEAAEAVIDKYSGQLTELRNEMLTKHSVLEAMINKGDADEKKMGKLITEMSELRDKTWDIRNTMTQELEKVTGLALSRGNGDCPRYGRGGSNCGGYGQGNGCSGYGKGYGRGANAPTS